VIDLNVVSDCDKVVQSGVLKTSFSDHFAMYCTRKISRPSIGTRNSVKLRSLKNYSKEAFQASLLSFDWNLVLLCNDVVETYTLFEDSFLSIIDTVAPVKQVRIKQR